MEQAVRTLFARYAAFFARALAGDFDKDEMAALYTPEFIAASPLGVKTGKNDAQLRQAMAQGYAHHRAIGTREMRLGEIRLSAIDDCHCVAHVGWTATYARDDLPETAIGFDVHYLVQVLAGEAEVFGWVTGDEEALMRQHGVM
ncbi:MAG: nuclear transport factor 2 family protein [Paracoccus sp. (in: a-proteobacteria)]|uniref:nuclear transport factor 2 family protein n=1 Tax=Paracoccus sp. TaxID=267 RepID=UPI0039E6BCC9